MKKIVIVLSVMLAAFFTAFPAAAATYTSYGYNAKSQAVKSPAPYIPSKQLSGYDLGVGELKEPADLYCDYQKLIYICDSGNNRIVVLNSDLSLNRIISEFKDGYFTGHFSGPSGVFVDKNTGILYVADTGNGRVVGLDENLVMVKRFDRPMQAGLFDENLTYAPVKVAVDNGGRVFVVSKDVYEGLMQFDSSGNFLGFVGANEVKISPVDYFWKKISTKAQASKLQLTLPTEFSNLEIDSEGYIYTTTNIVNTKNSNILVRRQNPSGDDVLKRNENLVIAGDVVYDEYSSDYKTGASNFADVTINGKGMYSLLDSLRGRIFTYDFDGNLLYVFGGDGNNGNDIGCFYTPVSMIKNGENYIVLDISNGMLTEFEPTRYGTLINSAVSGNYDGKYDAAAGQWREVLRLNANCEQAYVGIGISQLRSGDYTAAMKNFKLGANRAYYSKAFKLSRQNWLEKNFVFMVAVIVAALTGLCLLIVRGEKNRKIHTNKKITNKTRFALYAVTHPFDGFYEMKREKMGSLSLSAGIVAFTILGFVLSKQLTGFILNYSDPAAFSLLDEAVKVIAVFLLFVVINWCVTALMDGEGAFREIINCTAAALIPLAVSLIPLTALSNVLTLEDAAFYYLAYAVVIIYTVFLLVVGVMETHQYTLAKTIGVLIITVLVMIAAVFLMMLFVNLINTMYDFVIKIYNEVIMR